MRELSANMLGIRQYLEASYTCFIFLFLIPTTTTIITTMYTATTTELYIIYRLLYILVETIGFWSISSSVSGTAFPSNLSSHRSSAETK